MIKVQVNNELRESMVEFIAQKATESRKKAETYKGWDDEAELVCSSLAASLEYMTCDFCRRGYVRDTTWALYRYARDRYCEMFPKKDRPKQPVENPYSKEAMGLFHVLFNRMDDMLDEVEDEED